MSRPRVVLVTQSYWPHLSESARACELLALALTQGGAKVQVLTAQFEQTPHGVFYDGPVPVIRLPHGPVSWWGPMRYWFALADWLKSHRTEYDVVCVSGLHYDAYSASQALAHESHPLVLRAETAGPGGDCHWQATARFGTRVKQRCQQAHRIIATAEPIVDELIAAGYDPSQLTLIENGIRPLPPRTPQVQLAARDTLRDAHAALRVPPKAPVVLCVDPIHTTEQLPPLLTFWKQVVQQVPEAQLWIIGQGRAYSVVPRLAERQQLELSVAVPGMFDDLTEFYEAADLLLLPFDTGGQSLAALEAMAIGLPVIARDTPANRALLANGTLGRLMPLDDPIGVEQFVAALAPSASPFPESAKLREHIVQNHSVANWGEQHLQLFEQLLAQRASA